MSPHFLDLPNEIIESIIFCIIGRPWKRDILDFLSFTSTCQRFYAFVNDERFWKVMALRRNPLDSKPDGIESWFSYCQQIARLRTIRATELIENISRYNNEYVCTIQKVSIWPDRIQIFIDERGDFSLGLIQHPNQSRLRFSDRKPTVHEIFEGMQPMNCEFTIADASSRYLGYLEFSLVLTSEHLGQMLLFEYGESGYSCINLFVLDENFLNNSNISLQY